MKKLLIGLIGFGLFSCDPHNMGGDNMGIILDNCKGHAVVVTTGINTDMNQSVRYHIIIKDDSSNCFEYIGSQLDVKKGDTLK